MAVMAMGLRFVRMFMLMLVFAMAAHHTSLLSFSYKITFVRLPVKAAPGIPGQALLWAGQWP
jgi:hypothetical protein